MNTRFSHSRRCLWGLQRIRSLETEFFFDFIACSLIILFHFANYVTYAEYSRIFPDIGLVVAVLLGVAALLTGILQIPSMMLRIIVFTLLINIVIGEAIYEFGVANVSLRLLAMTITIFIVFAAVFYLREHLNKVLIAAFLAMLFSTLGIAHFAGSSGGPTARVKAQTGSTKPVILHLILDEHIGLAGIPPELAVGQTTKQAMREFYLGEDFRIFGNAYSPFFETSMSIASAMNFDDTGVPHKFLTDRLYGYSLDQNKYLQEAMANGYRINIYQSNYFDLCDGVSPRVQKCATYKPDVLSAREIGELPLANRIRLLTNMYVSSFAVIKALKIVQRLTTNWFRKWGIELPRLGVWHGRIGPLAVAQTLSQLETDLAHSSGGTLFLAHLLMPHYPYVYTADCKIRLPLSSWKLRQPENGRNTADSRSDRYRDYFEQIACTMKKLSRLFTAMKRAGIFKDATIIVHGDHGSRINLTGSGFPRHSRMTGADIRDDFSTLFAIKSPGVVPEVDLRQLSLPRLLAYAVKRDSTNIRKTDRPSVFLRTDKNQYVKTPIPGFRWLGK